MSMFNSRFNCSMEPLRIRAWMTREEVQSIWGAALVSVVIEGCQMRYVGYGDALTIEWHVVVALRSCMDAPVALSINEGIIVASHSVRRPLYDIEEE